jgi:hypothetical protein
MRCAARVAQRTFKLFRRALQGVSGIGVVDGRGSAGFVPQHLCNAQQFG